MNRKTHAFALLALLAIVIAGCGGGSSSSEGNYGGEGSSGNKSSADSKSASAGGNRYGNAGSGSEANAAGSESGAAVVSLGNTKVGMVLVDSNGMTLYDFHKDKGTTSSCYGACAENWPPMQSEGEPTVGNGASASKLGTTERKDGTTQVTYDGHPLYTYVGDQGPGEANGNDISAFGGQWYALKGNGEEAGD